MQRFKPGLVIVLLMVFSVPVLANPFTDVPFSHWAYDAIKKLSEKGIMSGMPDGTFKGEKGVTRYELAVTLARALEKISSLKGKVDVSDIRTIEKLTVEFADELALLGVKMAALEEELEGIRDVIASIKAEVTGFGTHGGGCSGIQLTGDSKIAIDILQYENDTVVDPKDDLFTYYQIGFNFAAPIDEDVSSFMRIVNDDILGMEFDALEDMNFGVDLAFVDVRDFFGLGDIRIGRQFAGLGHSLVLDDKLDAITFSKDIENLKIVLLGADTPSLDRNWDGVNEIVVKNGFNLKLLDMKYAFSNHEAEFYFAQTALVNADPTVFGLSMNGNLVVVLDYYFEYS